MTIYLRNTFNKTVVDIELNDGKNGIDIHVSIAIVTYSKILLNFLHRADEVIKDFDTIDNLRGWFWEVYMEQADTPSIKEIRTQIDLILVPISEKYLLNYIID